MFPPAARTDGQPNATAMTNGQTKFERMTTQPVPRLVASLAMPTIVSMLVTSLYNMADTYFMGQISTAATAAVGIAFPVMSVVQAVGFFFGHGSGNFISRRLGAGDLVPARRMAATGFYAALLTGLCLAALGYAFLTPLCRALGATDTILPLAETYVGIVMAGAPFMTASLVLNNQMRFQGNAAYAMVGIVSGAVLNVMLAPLLIFVAGWGIAGAAAATVVCQAFSFCLLLFMTRRGGTLSVAPRHLRWRRSDFVEIVRGGSPSLSRQALACLATLLLNHAAAAYGDAAIAGMSIVTRITFFIFSFLLGFGQGFQPVCGFNYGAGLNGRVLSGFWFCVRVGGVFMLLCSALGFVFAPEVVHLFRADPAVVAVGTDALRWQLLVLPLNVFVTISNMTLQTIRKSGRAVLLASARQGLFFIPLIVVLPRWFGLSGVEACQAVSDLLAFVLAVPLMTGVLRELKR